MVNQTKYREHSDNELSYLREQNHALSTELEFHREVFKQVQQALRAAKEFHTDEVVKRLAEENKRLKNQLKLARLSDRETEILKLIVNGHTSKEIAASLNISKLTVDTHRKHIQQKLEVVNMVELLKIAMQTDLN